MSKAYFLKICVFPIYPPLPESFLDDGVFSDWSGECKESAGGVP